MNKEIIRRGLTGQACTVEIAATRKMVKAVISDANLVEDSYNDDKNDDTTHVLVLTLDAPVAFENQDGAMRQGMTAECFCNVTDLGILQANGIIRNAQLRAIGQSSSVRVNITIQ